MRPGVFCRHGHLRKTQTDLCQTNARTPRSWRRAMATYRWRKAGPSLKAPAWRNGGGRAKVMGQGRREKSDTWPHPIGPQLIDRYQQGLALFAVWLARWIPSQSVRYARIGRCLGGRGSSVQIRPSRPLLVTRSRVRTSGADPFLFWRCQRPELASGWVLGKVGFRQVGRWREVGRVGHIY